MPLSSGTLIHFTNDKSALIKILEESFRVFHCRETVILGGKKQNFYVPMVSFCDIPLSEIKDHINKYGSYAIGLTKEWGIKSGLNPVLYVSQISSLSASYRTAMKHFVLDDDSENDDFTEEQKSLLDVIRYMKNYEAPLERKGMEISNYRFSDEREWRYVPSIAENCSMLIASSYFNDNSEEIKNELRDMRLKFDINDIKYIIINDDSEIGEFVDHLRRVNGKNSSLHDIERLTTRILTAEQIKTDM